MKLRHHPALPVGRACALLIVLLISVSARALVHAVPQQAPEPRREQILNGLNILFLNRPGDPQMLIKLRINAGAAFDLEGKEGLMTLLGDALFADPALRRYVSEDLGGRLDVQTSYDTIDVILTGRAEEFERLVELLRNALINTQLSADIIGRLREARTKTAQEKIFSPEMIADRAIAARLFGAYPYGRLLSGTPETLSRIHRADLMLARERFLNPNNSTLVLIGGVDAGRALRAVRQFLGVWRKSEQIVPATFRQPEAPDSRLLIVDVGDTPGTEVRLAARGVARSDKDAAAVAVLSEMVRERWRAAVPEALRGALTVRHDAYQLGGLFRLSASAPTSALAAQALEAARGVLQNLAANRPSPPEVERAKLASAAGLARSGMGTSDALADQWLDAQTYNSPLTADAAALSRALTSVTPSEIERIAARLFRDPQLAMVVVGDAGKLRSELRSVGEIEVIGAGKTSAAKPTGPRIDFIPKAPPARP